MKKIILILCFFVFITACGRGQDQLNIYEGIPTAEIPGHCLESREDICALFDCMVDQCWCNDFNPMLVKGSTSLMDENDAITVVEQFISEGNVQRAVKLNTVFYNVFVDVNGDEEVYTVAADGTIIKTLCGI